MAKIVMLKSLDERILPITRGELVLDSSGNQAFHSNEFLATESQPGLTKINYVEISTSNISNTPDESVQVIQVKSSSDKVYPMTSADAVLVEGEDGAVTLSETLDGIKAEVIKYLPLSGGIMTGTINSQHIIPTSPTSYNLGTTEKQWKNVYATTFTGNLKGAMFSVLSGQDSGNITEIPKAIRFDSHLMPNTTTGFGSGHNNAILTIGRYTTERYASQLGFSGNGKLYYRSFHSEVLTDSKTWKQIAFTSDIPTSLKNPSALTIQGNGTALGSYDGSEAKTVNITPTSIGALSLTGGMLTGSLTIADNILKITNGKSVVLQNPWYASNQGGWARDQLYAMGPADSDGNAPKIYSLGSLGSGNALTYIYLGAGKDYSSTNNLRIYPDGRVSAPSFTGNVTGNLIGNASSATIADTVSISQGSSDLWRNMLVTTGANDIFSVPNVYANYSKGALKAKSVYISGSANNTTAHVTSDSIHNMYFSVDGVIPLVINTSSTTNPCVRASTGLPGAVDLGSDSTRWRNVYATTFNGNLTGNASTATALTVKSKGSATKPIYWDANGQPVACTYSLNKTVPANAVFTDTNYYPTTFTWTAGTTSGPTGSLTGSGMSAVTFGAIPAASGSASGIVTTGTQTFAGEKTFKSTLFMNSSSRIEFNTESNYINGGSSYLQINGASSTYFSIGGTDKLKLTTSALYPLTSGGITLGTTSYKFGDVYAASIGTSSYRCTYGYFSNAVYATSGFYQSSDETLKTILKPVEVNLGDLAKLRKVYYLWKDDSNKCTQLGMIAQDVQKVYPELVDVDKETGVLSLAYDKLSVVALAAVDKLQEEIGSLQKKNIELEDRISKLENLLLYGKKY